MNTRKFNASMLNDPFFIGFDSILNRLNQASSGNTSYPPYNLIKAGEDAYLIELAVAGFDEKDFDITLHDGVLTVSANVGDADDETEYLHKGIAARSFVRKFTLADTIEIESASLHQGMLTLRLKNVIPEEKKPKQIPINTTLKSEPTYLAEAG